MEELPELEFVSWEEVQLMGFELSLQLNQLRPDLDTIVSVSRGGHVLARMLSDFLQLPIFSVSIQSYEALQQTELQITQELHVDLGGKHVLLVDEIVDSGKTLERALEYLHGFGTETMTSVAMHVKPKATTKSDFFVTETSKWVVYPYEVKETIESLWPIWRNKGLLKQDLARVLLDGGFKIEFVETYLDRLD